MHLKKCILSNLEGNVLVRVDLNLPKNDTQLAKHPRVITTVNLLKQLIENDKITRIIIMSHRGRPSGFDENLSLQPYLSMLEQAIASNIFFVHGNILPSRHQVDGYPCKVVLLDNLRFHVGEEENDPTFAKQLATLGDVYINNAISVVHREHASVVAIIDQMPSDSCFAGPALISEIERLDALLSDPVRPFLVILGGAKPTDKLPLAIQLAQLADVIAVGGAFAMASPEGLAQLQLACALHDTRLILPSDLVQKDGLTMDIGPDSVSAICEAIKGAKTVFWNGPVGKFEEANFASGTQAIADCLHQEFIQRSEQGFTSVIGGGDTVQAFGDRLATFYCTGGGASMTYVASGCKLSKLPGLRKLIAH